MWINVKDAPYNANGDGTTDDTAAIQAAINAAQVAADPDKRNVVYFPVGEYRVTDAVEVYHNQGIRLVGAGDVAGLAVNVGGYGNPPVRLTGAVVFWDGAPGGTLLRFKGSYDGTLENLTFVGATPQRYTFSTSTTAADPGDGNVRFDSGTFASITQIFANFKNFYGVEIPSWLDGLDNGTAGRLTVQERNSSNFAIFDVTGSVTGSGTWRTINVKPVQSSGTGVFADEAQLILSFVRAGGTPQPYAFSEALSGDPAPGELRFDGASFPEVANILVSDETASEFVVSGWLNSIAGADVRVTVQHATNSAIFKIFRVNGVSDNGDYHEIAVTPIVESGTIADEDPVVLMCSKVTPIRDRAGALVSQVSEVGWPSGHMLIENCTFLEADDGLRLDELTSGNGTNNCADNTILQSNFFHCGAGIKCNWNQVVNNKVINCDFTGCTVAIDHVKGGDLRVSGSSMNGYEGEVFLRIGQGGFNASAFLLDGVRLEMKAGKPSLVETLNTNEFDTTNLLIDGFGWVGFGWPGTYSETTSYSKEQQVRVNNTIYESLIDSNVGNNPSTFPDKWRWLGDWVRPVRLSENTNCTIRGAYVKGPFASVVGDVARSTLRLDNCRLGYNAPDMVTTGTNGIWKTVDCTDGQGLPIDIIGNWPAQTIYTPDGTNVASGTGGAALPVTVQTGAGGTGIPGSDPDINGGAGGDIAVIAGNGADGFTGEDGSGVANGGAGGRISLQAGIGGGSAQGGGTAGANGEVVVNDAGLKTNFRVESDTDANCLVVDATNNAVRLGGMTGTRVYLTAPNSAPTDAKIGASQVSLWVDEAADPPLLKVRVKYADGTTLKTGEIVLS